MLLDTAVSWPSVAIALIAGLPAIIAAVLAASNRSALRTPSGTTIGKQVEDTNHTAIVTHHNVTRLAQEATEQGEAREERQAGKLEEVHALVNDASAKQLARIAELEQQLREARGDA